MIFPGEESLHFELYLAFMKSPIAALCTLLLAFHTTSQAVDSPTGLLEQGKETALRTPFYHSIYHLCDHMEDLLFLYGKTKDPQCLEAANRLFRQLHLSQYTDGSVAIGLDGPSYPRIVELFSSAAALR